MWFGYFYILLKTWYRPKYRLEQCLNFYVFELSKSELMWNERLCTLRYRLIHSVAINFHIILVIKIQIPPTDRQKGRESKRENARDSYPDRKRIWISQKRLRNDYCKGWRTINILCSVFFLGKCVRLRNING